MTSRSTARVAQILITANEIMELTSYGRALFGPTRNTNLILKYNDFTIRQDGASHWVYFWGDQKHYIARFKGTFAEANRALKVALVTHRLSS